MSKLRYFFVSISGCIAVTFITAAALSVAVSGNEASNFSSVDYIDVFCGTALPTFRAEPVVLPPHETSVTVDVAISGFAFTPQNLTVNVGDTVRWTNFDGTNHTTTSNTGVWNSGNFASGSFSFTFNNAGTFPYHCSRHGSMTATLTVQVPSPTSTNTPTPTDTPTPTNTATSTPTNTATATNTQTNTATNTPTPSGPPTLGIYPNTVVNLSSNATITPDAPPTNALSMSVETSTGFVGELTADPVTGIVRVTNAHHVNIPPSGYAVIVKAFGPFGTATRAFMLTVTTPPICNPVGFVTTNFGSGTTPDSIAIGDFNTDGIQDIATANINSDNLSLLLGDGAGNFEAATNFGTGSRPVSIAAGDFNGDGKQDLVTANTSSNNVSVLLGDGIGSFSSTTNFATDNYPMAIVIGDFNDDYRQDVATANYLSNNLSVLLGDGAGGFTGPMNFGPVASPRPLVIGDFNQDGKQDLATTSGSDNVSIFLGDGIGNFSAPTNIYLGTGVEYIVVADFNKDNKQDLAVTGFYLNGVSILLGDGTGGFGTPASFGSGAGSWSIAAGDFSGDGKQDLAIVNYTTSDAGNLSILLGDGNGAFSAATNFGTGNGPYALAVGDFNGDSKQDIGVVNSNSNNVSILLRICREVSGTVTYGNSNTGTKFISNVTVTGTGSPNVFTTTAAPGATAGQYTLIGFGTGSYTVSLSKTTGQNGIASADAARIAQHVANTGPGVFTNDRQKVAADVTGNGAVSSQDAAKIAQYVAGFSPLPTPNLTGQWRFYLPPGPTFPIGSSPTTRTYSSVTSNLTGEDYIGLLIGEVTGNWTPSAARPISSRSVIGNGPERSISIDLPKVVTSVDKEIFIPVNVQGVADKDVISYEFDLRYDPLVMQPDINPVDLKGSVSRGLSYVINSEKSGLLRVVAYGPMPIDENGVLLNLRFTALGKPGSMSPLTFERFMFNEGLPITTTDGQVEIR